ncbi:MAG: hypothetical protein ACP5LP_01955 [Candidatus Micrarchaeia archaeon]
MSLKTTAIEVVLAIVLLSILIFFTFYSGKSNYTTSITTVTTINYTINYTITTTMPYTTPVALINNYTGMTKGSIKVSKPNFTSAAYSAQITPALVASIQYDLSNTFAMRSSNLYYYLMLQPSYASTGRIYFPNVYSKYLLKFSSYNNTYFNFTKSVAYLYNYTDTEIMIVGNNSTDYLFNINGTYYNCTTTLCNKESFGDLKNLTPAYILQNLSKPNAVISSYNGNICSLVNGTFQLYIKQPYGLETHGNYSICFSKYYIPLKIELSIENSTYGIYGNFSLVSTNLSTQVPPFNFTSPTGSAQSPPAFNFKT